MIRYLCFAALAAVVLPFSAIAQLGPPQERYIVVLNEGLDLPEDVAADVAIRTGGRVGYVYEHALRGFSITMPRAAVAAIQRDPRVDYVEEDRPVRLFAQEIPTGIQRIFADENGNIDINDTDDWRVDVDVAVIDTGIDFEHPDLNVVGGIDCSGGGPFNARCKSGGDDDHFHGTHVAGTIGALDNGIGVVGVAPGARLWAVKVLGSNGSAWTAQIVAGIDWVAANADTIEVANMSLGGSGYSQAEYDAIQGAVDAGVAFAVAAGNDNDDANNYSPAAFDNVLTVSALADFDGEAGGRSSPGCRSDQDDTLADFSNWGSAVGIAAPGVCILSTYPIEQGEYGTISGTSMASPHVAGALALLASGTGDFNSDGVRNADDVQELYQAVIEAGNVDWNDDSPEDPVMQERLLDVSNTALFNPVLVPGSGGGGGSTDDPPSVSVTNPTNGATVSGAITVTADATDDNGVSQVEFFVGGGSIGVDDNGSDGWSILWDTTASADDIYTVGATATDSIGQTANDSVSVTVDNLSGGGSGVTLSLKTYKVRGTQHADLDWGGTSTGSVDVYVNGDFFTTTEADPYTHTTEQKGGGSASYQVCETKEGGSCSNVATATW